MKEKLELNKEVADKLMISNESIEKA